MAINLNLPKLFKQFDNTEWTKEQFLAATESDDYKDLICLDSTNGWLAKNGVMYGSGSNEALDLFANIYDGPIDFVEHITLGDLARKLTYKNTPLKATITIDSELYTRFTLVNGTKPSGTMNVCAIVYSDDSDLFVSHKLHKMPIPKMCAVYFGHVEPNEEGNLVFDPNTELTIFRHYASYNMPTVVLKRLGIYNALTSPKITVPTATNNNIKYRRPLIGTVHSLVRKSILNDKVTTKSALINPFVNVGDRILIDGSGTCRSLADFFLSRTDDLFGSTETLEFIKTYKAQYGSTIWVDLYDHMYYTMGTNESELQRNLQIENGTVLPKDDAGMCIIESPKGRLSVYNSVLNKKIVISKDMYDYLTFLESVSSEAVVIAKVQCYEVKYNKAVVKRHKTYTNDASPVYTFVIRAKDFVPCGLPGSGKHYEFDCGDVEGNCLPHDSDFISIKHLYIPFSMDRPDTVHSIRGGVVLYHYSNHYVDYTDRAMSTISNSLKDNVFNRIDFKLAVTQKMNCADVMLPTRGGIIIPSVNYSIDRTNNACANPRLYKYVKSEDAAIKTFDNLCKKAVARRKDNAGDGSDKTLTAFEQFEKYMFSPYVALYAKWLHCCNGFENNDIMGTSKTKFVPITMTRTRKFFDRTATPNLEHKVNPVTGIPSSNLTSKKYLASNFIYGARFADTDSGTVYKNQKVSEAIMIGEHETVSKNYLARLFSKLMFGNAKVINENAETENWVIRNRYLGDIDRYHKVKYVDVIAMPIFNTNATRLRSARRAKYLSPKYGRKFRIKFDMSEFSMADLNEMLWDVNNAVHNVQADAITYQAYGDSDNKNAFVDAISRNGTNVGISGDTQRIRVSVIDMGFDFVQ